VIPLPPLDRRTRPSMSAKEPSVEQPAQQATKPPRPGDESRVLPNISESSAEQPAQQATKPRRPDEESGVLPNIAEAGIFAAIGGTAAAAAAIPAAATGNPLVDTALAAAAIMGGLGMTSGATHWFRRIRWFHRARSGNKGS